jgi:hypothetical protein
VREKKHGNISRKRSGGYGLFSVQYNKLEHAYELDRSAALRSASWGRFQIMGDNFAAAGFGSVEEFVLAMTRSESEHLKAFANLVMSRKELLTTLRSRNWAGFATAYNGSGYKKNDYDKKMKEAYDRFGRIRPADSLKEP